MGQSTQSIPILERWKHIANVLMLAGLMSLLVLLFCHASRPISEAASYSCDESGLDAALSSSGSVDLSCTQPTTVTVSATKVVATDVSLDGEGLLVISGNGATRVFSVAEGTDVTFANMVIRDGAAVDGNGGGGIHNKGYLTLKDVTLTNNTSGSSGGGVYNTGTLEVVDSLVDDNSVSTSSAAYVTGGGIHNSGGTLQITRSVISDNRVSNSYPVGQIDGWGGGIYNSGTLQLVDSSVISNRITISTDQAGSAGGGGIWSSGWLSMANTSVLSNCLDNRAPTSFAQGSGINISGIATIDGAEIGHNTIEDEPSFSYGGGIYMGYSSRLALMNSTVSHNDCTSGWYLDEAGGGGIYVGNAIVTISNTTIASNTTNAWGGGILSRKAISITNSTVANNTANEGGNLYFEANGRIQLQGTIVAHGTPTNCSIPAGSLGHNLDSGDTCGLTATGDITSTAPLLGPLQDNGGRTPTMALHASSPAVDAGDDATCPATDQRGAIRPADGDNNGSTICDIGAFEFGASMPNPFPVLSKVQPTMVEAGGPEFELTLTGQNFVSDSVALWAGGTLTTSFVSDSMLTATVPSDRIAVAGAISITVRNPAPGGGTAVPPLSLFVFTDRVFLPIVSR